MLRYSEPRLAVRPETARVADRADRRRRREQDRAAQCRGATTRTELMPVHSAEECPAPGAPRPLKLKGRGGIWPWSAERHLCVRGLRRAAPQPPPGKRLDPDDVGCRRCRARCIERSLKPLGCRSPTPHPGSLVQCASWGPFAGSWKGWSAPLARPPMNVALNFRAYFSLT